MAPVKKKPTKAKGYQPISTEGKLFRVRDKDYGDGSDVVIWGENLTYDAARALKEKICATKKSRTARVEEMSATMPSADPTLETVRQKGLAAGRAAASAAQHRADQLAARRRQEAKAASSPKPLRPAPNVKHKPLAMESLDADLEVPEVPDEDEGIELDDEVSAAEVQAESDANEYEKNGKKLYDAYTLGSGGIPDWSSLDPKQRAAFSFEAASGQGPHVDAVAMVNGVPPSHDEIPDSESAPS